MATQATRMQKSGAPEIKTPPILLDQTQKILASVEAVLKEPLVTYWNGPNGSICANDVTGLYGVLRTKGKVERLSLFVKSDGGSGQVSLRMVNLLRQFTKRLTVLAPLECASAATMLALGADRDKDWHYRTEERRWVTLNDKSGWKRAELVNGRVELATFHIR